MESFIAGILLGLGVAIPIGPLNILIMNYSLSKFKLGFGVGLGAMSADLLYFALLSLGVLTLLNEPWILRILAIFGAGFLIYMSYASLLHAKKILSLKSSAPHEESVFACYLKGLLLNSINPFIIGFWLSLSSVVASNENVLLASLGVIISLFGWVFGLSFITSRARRFISSKTASIFAYISAVLMIAFALLLLYNTFFKEI